MSGQLTTPARPPSRDACREFLALVREARDEFLDGREVAGLDREGAVLALRAAIAESFVAPHRPADRLPAVAAIALALADRRCYTFGLFWEMARREVLSWCETCEDAADPEDPAYLLRDLDDMLDDWCDDPDTDSADLLDLLCDFAGEALVTGSFLFPNPERECVGQ